MKTRYILLLLLAAACSDDPKEFRGISYTGQLNCDRDSSSYWLVDMKVSTAADSLLFDTRSMGRKMELDVERMDTASALYQLLAKLCTGDSLVLQMASDSFYKSLGGQPPSSLIGQQLNATVLLHDKLNREQYQAHKQLFEERSIAQYVEQFRWNATYDSATGIWYEKLKTARHANGGFTKAKMKFVMKNISDQLLAFSKDDEPFVFDKNDAQMLRGLKFVGNLLHNKESIRAVIPSRMAFGPQGNQGVPPNQPVILELELLEIIE